MAALVAEAGPVRATTVNYVTPAVALVASAIVLGEPVTGWAVIGIALILAGCFLAAVRRPDWAKPRLPTSPQPGHHTTSHGGGQCRLEWVPVRPLASGPSTTATQLRPLRQNAIYGAKVIYANVDTEGATRSS